MTQIGTAPDRPLLRRVAVASAVGTTVEYYDYFIYATAAALVFGSQFFSALSPASGTLAAFAAFGAGYLTRPLGGVIAGHLGDRVGRKAVLVGSLLLMGLCTCAIGLLPTYATIGVWAPALLVGLRLLQGMCVGGEWGGAALMAVEHAPDGERGRYGAWCQVGVPAGILLAQLTFLFVNLSMTPAQFQAWGWRLPFLGSVVLVGVGLFVRLRLTESPVFVRLRDRGERSSKPLVEALRERPRVTLLAAASFLAHVTIGNVFLAYLLSYGTSVLRLPQGLMQAAVLVGAATFLLTVPLAGAWSDRVGRRTVYLVGSPALLVWILALFPLLDTRIPLVVVGTLAVLGVVLGTTNGAQSAWFAELFEPRYRYSGASLAFAVGALVGGGPAAAVSAGLQGTYGSWAISVYLGVVAAISLLAVVALRETAPRVTVRLAGAAGPGPVVGPGRT